MCHTMMFDDGRKMKAPHGFSKCLLLVSLLALLRPRTVLAWAAPSVGDGASRSTPPTPDPVVPSCSIVTGGNGYVGRAIVHEILNQGRKDGGAAVGEEVYSLVRPSRVAAETEYWRQYSDASDRIDNNSNPLCVQVLPYDMLDGGLSLQQALEQATMSRQPRQGDGTTPSCRVTLYHTAAVFGPTENHRQTALDNVRGTEDLVRTLARFCCEGGAAVMGDSRPTRSGPVLEGHLIVTSSMAAVRTSGQVPSNGVYYTHKDWNGESKLGASWGESYQWSKAESERKAWQLSRALRLSMTSLCPSFVFGPPATLPLHASTSRGGTASSVPTPSGSYSLELVGEWVRGALPVQSRLFVDVRDVARAHVRAALRPEVSAGQRYVVSTEARVPSQDIAEWLREACRSVGLGDPSLIHYDATFAGGAIRIGDREVEATDRLERELGVSLRPVKDTIVDMANILLQLRLEDVDVAPARSNSPQ